MTKYPTQGSICDIKTLAKRDPSGYHCSSLTCLGDRAWQGTLEAEQILPNMKETLIDYTQHHFLEALGIAILNLQWGS